MKTLATVLLTLALTAGTILSASAQFEGIINVKRTKGTKITNFRYHVAGNLLRIEELDGNGGIKHIMLVDADEQTCYTLNTQRKVYMDAYNNRRVLPVNSRVTKTENTKEIAGYKCTEYIVRNEGEGTEVHYWIGGDEFRFFLPTLQVMNRKDKLARYFQVVPDPGAGFPILGEEQDLNGKVRMRLEVVSFEKGEVDDAMFDIPEGYSEFEK